MRLNVDKVNEIIKAKTKEQLEINSANKALAQSKYLENAAQIEKLRQRIKEIDKELDSINGVSDNAKPNDSIII